MLELPKTFFISERNWRYNFRKVFISHLKYRPVWITRTLSGTAVVNDNYPGQSYEAAHNLTRTLAREGKVSWVEEI